MNIDSLPKDVVIHEILPNLDLKNLHELSLTSMIYSQYVKEELNKRIQKGDLDFSKHSTKKLFDLGRDSRFKYPVIKEILQRLKADRYGKLDTYYLFKAGGDERLMSYGTAVFKGNDKMSMNDVIQNLRSLVGNEIELEIDGTKTILSKDGAAGLFVGLYQTDQFQSHNIKLGHILIDEIDAVILFFPFPDVKMRYIIQLPNKKISLKNMSMFEMYNFDSLDFLSNLKISGVMVNQIFDRKTGQWINAVYQ